ncbi:hypothetical protein [Corynebacterium sp. H130]|uniref:hypothetical protein n=1 Tax=Corynebacterium sp. H130 TaxID=3133444 RepID=UPI003098B656
MSFLVFLPLWLLIAFTVSTEWLNLNPESLSGMALGWLVWVVLFYPLFQPLKTVTDAQWKASQNPLLELVGIPGVISGPGYSLSRQLANLRTSHPLFATAIHGERYLQEYHPYLVREYKWVIDECFDSERRKRAQYED